MNAKLSGSLKLLVTLAVAGLLVFMSVAGFGDDKSFSASAIKKGLDLAGGVSITYKTEEDASDEAMNDALYKLQLRADVYSTEAAVYKEGSNRITVEIPGVEDAEAILEDLGNPGALYFVYGKDNIVRDTTAKSGYKLARSIEEIREAGGIVLTGNDIADAKAGSRQSSDYSSSRDYVVSLYLTDEGAEKFAVGTANSVGQQIAIIYDDDVVSAPIVNQAITGGSAEINHMENYDVADQLASTIRIGALPMELSELRSSVVGARLGQDAIRTSLIAGAVGMAILVLFMICYYRVPGFAASLALVIYVGLMVFFLNAFEATLTLQGIAGIILSIGMAVDANVIIFQRIREEIGKGLTVRSAMKNGFKKAFSAILDGNVTTLIAALVLFIMTSGGVKGFATTLAIGIVLSMFTALVVTRVILTGLYEIGFKNEKLYGIAKERETIHFVKYSPKFAVASCVLILAGFVGMIVFGIKDGKALNYGLDFSGGTSLSVTLPDKYSDNMNLELEKLVSATISKTSQITKISGENTYIIKTMEIDQDQRASLINALVEKYNADESQIQTDNISGSVSAEMRRRAIIAVAVAVVCMLIYIWLRFKNFNFAASAVIALVHDVLMVLMLYALVRISVGNSFIACMLTIVGYSINATIVIFDRIRENMAEKLKKESVTEIVDRSITQTLSRSINTSLTTFLMVLALVIFGVDSIREFAVPLMFGIVAGAYSSVCITGPLWHFMETRLTKRDEE
ncbi:MAG: protein translocase subunit SecD [Lachnospiraceae bacterium]|nr:protein translocase subunit SecD [Lachnospiraceae bacterium]